MQLGARFVPAWTVRGLTLRRSRLPPRLTCLSYPHDRDASPEPVISLSAMREPGIIAGSRALPRQGASTAYMACNRDVQCVDPVREQRHGSRGIEQRLDPAPRERDRIRRGRDWPRHRRADGSSALPDGSVDEARAVPDRQAGLDRQANDGSENWITRLPSPARGGGSSTDRRPSRRSHASRRDHRPGPTVVNKGKGPPTRRAADLSSPAAMVGVARIELATPAMSTQCSTTELHARGGALSGERSGAQAVS